MEEAQRKITDYYKNDKKLLQGTTTRQDTQQDKKIMKDTRTRQEIQDKKRYIGEPRQAIGKQSQKRSKSAATTTEDPPMMCMARMGTGADLTQTTVEVTTMNRNMTKGAQRMVTFTAGMIQAVKVDRQPS
jgi:hypothetical protein